MKIAELVKSVPTRIKPYIEGIKLAKLVQETNPDNTNWGESEYDIGSLHYLWGITSSGDGKATLWTNNDIDVTYDSSLGKYFLGIETIYWWEGGAHEVRQNQKKHLMSLYRGFRSWMVSKGYDISYKPDIMDVFHYESPLLKGFDTLPQLYAYFRILVTGFCSEVEPNEE